MVVSVVISGIPRNVSISSLALNLDQLFHTNEISSFRARALPLNVKGKPQAALDFKSGFDAMAAQEILNGYTYEIDDREYILRAKVTNDPSVMHSDSSATSDLDTSLVRHSRGKDRRSRVTNDVDTELNNLSKKLLVVEQERKLIKARRKLKKELKKFRSDSDTDANIEPEKKKKKKKHHKHKSKRSTSRRRSFSRDSSLAPKTPPLAMRPSRSKSRSRIRSRSLSSLSSWSEGTKVKEITFPVVRKSRSKNRSRSPISISSSGSEKPSRKSKASYSVKKSRSRSQETLALVPYRSTSAEKTPARRDSPQPSTSRARDRDYSRKRTSRNRSPKMSERRRLRSRSLSRSRSPIGRRSPRPSSSRHKASPRKSRWSPARRRSRSASRPRRSRYDSRDRSVALRSRRSRSASRPRRSRYDSADDRLVALRSRRSRSTSRPRYRDYGTAHKEAVYVARAHRTLYQAENYDCSITEVESDQNDATWAGVDEVLKDADKSQAEEKIEEETAVETASEKINVVINVVKKKTEDKKLMPVPMILDGNSIKKESDDVKKTTGVTITNTGEYDPELIKKMMPRPMVLDADMIKKEVDKEKIKNKIPRPIVVEMDNIKQEAEVDKEKSKKKVAQPIIVQVDNVKQEASETETENPIMQSPSKREVPRPNADKRPATNPQFHIPVVKLLKQMRPRVDEVGEDPELKCKVLKVAKDRLISRLNAVLIGKPYMNNTALCVFYRKCYPLDKDEEFVKKILEDIENGKCDHILRNDEEFDHILHHNPNNGKSRASQEFQQELKKKLSLGHLVLHLRVTEQSQTSQVETEDAQTTIQVPNKIKKERPESKKSRSEKQSSSDPRSHVKTIKDKSKSKVVAVDEDVAILEKVPEVIDLSESEDDCRVLEPSIKLENSLECTEMPQRDKKNKTPEIAKSENIQNIVRAPQKIIDNPEMSIEEIRSQNECEVLQDVIKSEKSVEHTDLPRTDKKGKEEKGTELRNIAVRRPADDVINPIKQETSQATNDLEPNSMQEVPFTDDLYNEIKPDLNLLSTLLPNDRTEEIINNITNNVTSTLEEVKTELTELPEESIESIGDYVTFVTNVINID